MASLNRGIFVVSLCIPAWLLGHFDGVDMDEIDGKELGWWPG